jgi:hypothetical protein
LLFLLHQLIRHRLSLQDDIHLQVAVLVLLLVLPQVQVQVHSLLVLLLEQVLVRRLHFLIDLVISLAC